MADPESKTSPAVNLPFTEEGMMQKVARTPLSVLAYNLVEYPHDEGATGTGYLKLQNRLLTRLNLSDQDEARLLSGTSPQNRDEEELLCLINLRGSIGRLWSLVLQDPHFPDEYGQRLFANAVYNSSDDAEHSQERSTIVAALAGQWHNQHPTEDTPITINETVANQLHSVYENGLVLMRHYSDRPQIVNSLRLHYWDKLPDGADQALHDMSEEDQLRYSVMQHFVFMFGPDEPGLLEGSGTHRTQAPVS